MNNTTIYYPLLRSQLDQLKCYHILRTINVFPRRKQMPWTSSFFSFKIFSFRGGFSWEGFSWEGFSWEGFSWEGLLNPQHKINISCWNLHQYHQIVLISTIVEREWLKTKTHPTDIHFTKCVLYIARNMYNTLHEICIIHCTWDLSDSNRYQVFLFTLLKQIIRIPIPIHL